MTTRELALDDQKRQWRDTQLTYDGELFSYSEYTNEVIREGHRLVVDLCERVAAKRRSPLTIVDVGCGWTDFYPKLAHLTKTYVGIEPSAGQIRRAPHRSNMFLVRGVGERLIVSDGAADVVLLISVLDHCLDASTVLAEAFRVLRPGGTAILLLENRGRLSNLVRRLLGVDIQHGEEHLHYFDVDDLVSLVEPLGTVTFMRSYGYLLGFDFACRVVPGALVVWLRRISDAVCSPILVKRGQHFIVSVDKPGDRPPTPLRMQCQHCRQPLRWGAVECESCRRPLRWIEGGILDVIETSPAQEHAISR